MKLHYNIACRHCGAHTEYITTTNRRTQFIDNIELSMHIDTECAIRCPVCRSRLNSSEAEFRAQVSVVREA